jgi:ribulose-phosphate 3-epimerase
MVERPEHYIREYAELGVSVFTFHPEATHHVQRHLASIRERGMKAGLSLNPGTPLSYLEEVVDDVDLVLVMSVNPGFGGQAYIPASTAKITGCANCSTSGGRAQRSRWMVASRRRRSVQRGKRAQTPSSPGRRCSGSPIPRRR